jgi:hypothetical protein
MAKEKSQLARSRFRLQKNSKRKSSSAETTDRERSSATLNVCIPFTAVHSGGFIFTETEALLLTEALRGVTYDANTAPMLWAHVDDAVNLQGLDQRHGVDREALVQKLKALGDLEAMAVVDAVERYWHLQGEPGERLRKVGLVRDPVEEGTDQT